MFADAIGDFAGGVLATAGGWVNKPAGADYWYKSRGTTVAGVDVDEEQALTFTTFFACVNKLAKTIATLPVDVYEKTGEDTRRPVSHEVEELLNGQANENALGVTVREAMAANIIVWGRGYAEVIPSNDGRRIRELVHLPAKWMKPKTGPDGRRYYEYRPEGAAKADILPADRILHVPGLSLNGVDGLSVVAYNRLAIALGLAATRFGAAFFGNGAWAGGFVKRSSDADRKAKMSREDGQRFLDSLNERFRGPDKAFGFALLREDMDFTQLQMPFEDAMFLGTRRFTREDICGLVDVPPSKIQDHTRSTFSNVEHLDIAWAKDSILPWCVRLEAAYKWRFFRGTRLYAKHNLAGLMRGDLASRMTAYVQGILNGIWSINDVRRMEDMNPIEGGDEHYRPLNVGRVGDPMAAAAVESRIQAVEERIKALVTATAPDADRQRERAISREIERSHVDIEAFRPVVADACRRIVAKETKAIGNAWKRRSKEPTTESFAAWLAGFYSEQADFAERSLSPILAGYERAGGLPGAEAAAMARDYAEPSYAAVRDLLANPTEIPALLAEWEKAKAEELTETILAAMSGGECNGVV